MKCDDGNQKKTMIIKCALLLSLTFQAKLRPASKLGAVNGGGCKNAFVYKIKNKNENWIGS